MGDDEDAAAAVGDVAGDAHDPLLVVEVERGGRLVEEEQRRALRQDAGERRQRLLAAGEAPKPSLREMSAMPARSSDSSTTSSSPS